MLLPVSKVRVEVLKRGWWSRCEKRKYSVAVWGKERGQNYQFNTLFLSCPVVRWILLSQNAKTIVYVGMTQGASWQSVVLELLKRDFDFGPQLKQRQHLWTLCRGIHWHRFVVLYRDLGSGWWLASCHSCMCRNASWDSPCYRRCVRSRLDLASSTVQRTYPMSTRKTARRESRPLTTFVVASLVSCLRYVESHRWGICCCQFPTKIHFGSVA